MADVGLTALIKVNRDLNGVAERGLGVGFE